MRIRAVLDRNGYHVTDGGNEIILADMESVASRKFQRHHQFKFAGRKGKWPFRDLQIRDPRWANGLNYNHIRIADATSFERC